MRDITDLLETAPTSRNKGSGHPNIHRRTIRQEYNNERKPHQERAGNYHQHNKQTDDDFEYTMHADEEAECECSE